MSQVPRASSFFPSNKQILELSLDFREYVHLRPFIRTLKDETTDPTVDRVVRHHHSRGEQAKPSNNTKYGSPQ